MKPGSGLAFLILERRLREESRPVSTAQKMGGGEGSGVVEKLVCGGAMSLMRLSTFWAVHGALSAAEEPGPLARQIAARWPHDPGTLRLFRSSANSVYRFDEDGQGRFLRFAAAPERPRRLIEAEVDLLQWLL